MSEPEIAGGTPREEPADGTPRKKARSGKAAVDRTEAAGAIKGVREAEAIDNDDVDESTSVGCRRPTTPVPITQAGRRRRCHERQALPSPTVADATGVDDDEVTSGGPHRPTTATTVADAANVDDDKATTGGRRRPTANVNTDEAVSGGCRRPTKTLPAG